MPSCGSSKVLALSFRSFIDGISMSSSQSAREKSTEKNLFYSLILIQIYFETKIIREITEDKINCNKHSYHQREKIRARFTVYIQLTFGFSSDYGSDRG